MILQNTKEADGESPEYLSGTLGTEAIKNVLGVTGRKYSKTSAKDTAYITRWRRHSVMQVLLPVPSAGLT